MQLLKMFRPGHQGQGHSARQMWTSTRARTWAGSGRHSGERGYGLRMGVRDGVPLPGRTPAEVVSQLTHRIFGPLRLDRVRVVLDYHGLAGSPAAGRPEIAARYRITPPTVGNRVAKVRAAGSRLPLHPGIVDQATRASAAGDDHLGRVRIAATLDLPLPAAAPLPAAPPALPVPPVASGRAAARLLAAVGPTDIATLVAAVNRSRSYRRGALIAADALSAALTAVGAVPGIDGTWSPPPGMVAPAGTGSSSPPQAAVNSPAARWCRCSPRPGTAPRPRAGR
jgi:hypothetical protein